MELEGASESPEIAGEKNGKFTIDATLMDDKRRPAEQKSSSFTPVRDLFVNYLAF